MFTAARFTRAKTQKQLKCPMTDEWIKIMIYIYMQRVRHDCATEHTHTHRYTYTQWNNTEERNDVICSNMDGPIILTEVKDKYHMILLTCGI